MRLQFLFTLSRYELEQQEIVVKPQRKQAYYHYFKGPLIDENKG